MVIRTLFLVLSLAMSGLPAIAQEAPGQARSLRDATLDARDEVARVLAASRAPNGGRATAMELRMRQLEDELVALSSEDSSKPGWAERSQISIQKIFADFEQIRVDASRAGVSLDIDYDTFVALISDITEAYEAEKASVESVRSLP